MDSVLNFHCPYTIILYTVMLLVFAEQEKERAGEDAARVQGSVLLAVCGT
jgi:hypothetical protein